MTATSLQAGLELSAEEADAIREAVFTRLCDMKDRFPEDRPVEDDSAGLREVIDTLSGIANDAELIAILLESADDGELHAASVSPFLLEMLEAEEKRCKADLARGGERHADCRPLIARVGMEVRKSAE